MDGEPIGTGRLPPLGGRQSQQLLRHRGRSPDPLKTYPDYGSMVAGSGPLSHATVAAALRRGARPFDGRPGASRLLGGR